MLLPLVSSALDVTLVAEAASGAQLLDRPPRADVDLVILDVKMPPSGESEGYRIADALRRRNPRIGLVFLTSYDPGD